MSRHRSPPHWLAISTAVLLAHGGLLRAVRCEAAEPAPSGPGLVDGAPFVRLATDDDELVEIDLKPSVLRALARAANTKGKAGPLAGLTSVRAVIVGLDPHRLDVATKQIEATATELRSRGWEEMARVREKGTRIRVLLLGDHERVAGLTVLMVDHERDQESPPDGGPRRLQLVFANIVGPFDLADLGKLSGQLDIPGLDTALGNPPHREAGQGKAP